MCGIMAYVGQRPAAPIVSRGILRVLYRGYDAVGVAILGPDGPQVVRVVGPGIEVLTQKLGTEMEALLPKGTVGIGHNRWATHGGLTLENTHPHVDCTKRVILVHNGSVSQVDDLRSGLLTRSHRFSSDTDTEVLAHLIEEELQSGRSMLEVLRDRIGALVATYALVIIDVEDPGKLYIARRGSPLIVGIGEGETYVASDPVSFLDDTQQAMYLADGEYGVVTSEGAVIYSADGQMVTKEIVKVERSADAAKRGGHPHYMLKEILEQPTVMLTTMNNRLDVATGTVRFPESPGLEARLADITHLTVIASGSSYWAGCVGQRLFETMTHVPVTVVAASEFTAGMAGMVRRMPGKPAVVVISQSGETADAIAALTLLREVEGAHVYTLGIINVAGSTLTRLVDDVIDTRAGTEVSVASTKAFIAQVTVFCLLALLMGSAGKALSEAEAKQFAEALKLLPASMFLGFDLREPIQALAGRYAHFHHMFFLGRGIAVPMAAEGALKLMEIAYVHADAYPAGELKHGPLALMSPECATLVLCPRDAFYDLNYAAIAQIVARGGKVIAITSSPDEGLSALVTDVIVVPFSDMRLWPIAAVAAMQLFAYYMAIELGHNPDQPRNLAKSVTVQ